METCLFAVLMEIPEVEVQDILGYSSVIDSSNPTKATAKTMSEGESSTQLVPLIPQPGSVMEQPSPSPLETALVTELVATKQRLERVTEEMEGMKKEIVTFRAATTSKPVTRTFALGFIPSIVLAKSNVELLKWVAEVLSISMKRRMEVHRDHFKVITTVKGCEAIGARTCPIYNRIEHCSLKWHQMIKTTKTGRQRTELRIHCCTLCLEAMGIICGHPLLKCPWIYEDTWKDIPFSKVD